MGKPAICIGENKSADQLRSNCEADQCLCFRYTDSTIPLLSKSKISSLQPSSVTVQPGLCRTWSEPKFVGFLTHRLIFISESLSFLTQFKAFVVWLRKVLSDLPQICSTHIHFIRQCLCGRKKDLNDH